MSYYLFRQPFSAIGEDPEMAIYVFKYIIKWMRSTAERLARPTANTKVATVLASSDTVESEGRQMKQC